MSNHIGVDFSLFSKMEMKALEKHLSFNGSLPECKDKTCRVYDVYRLHLEEDEEDYVIDDVDYDYENEEFDSDLDWKAYTTGFCTVTQV